MSSFSTLNGVNAARTGATTARRPAAPQPYSPQPYNTSQPNTGPTQPAPAAPTGMLGTGSSPGGGMLGTNQGHVDPNLQAQFDAQARANDHGVRPGQQPQPQYAAPAAPQFDPNDPRNAALAGYMNG